MWVGGAPSMDFLNTLRARTLEPQETLTTPARLSLWLGRAGLLVDPADVGSEADLRQARALREAMDSVLVRPTRADGPTLDILNRWAARHRGPRLERAQGAGGDLRVVAAAPTARDALAALAADAIRLVQTGDADLLRICTHDRCGIRYLDRSRARNRRWCSMQRCGNRAKVARHAGRARLST